jgi:UDP-2,3-diacylglucosamine pyrophosphatase LpxH
VRYLVAGDWHLSPESPAIHGRLARAFLDRARAEGATVVLNGDVFEDLFAGSHRARAAHPGVTAALDALASEGRLLQARGNHDPGVGEDRIILDVPGLGRVLVAHGDAADPLHASVLGRLGDAISRRYGRLALVRSAARIAELAATRVAGARMRALFRGRCLALLEREGCALGVFGHVHVPHLAAGDRYVNAGGLRGGTLSYVALDPSGPRLLALRAQEATGRTVETVPK